MISRLSVFALISALLISAFLLAAPAPAAQSLMQCMTECVKSEGNDAAAKSTCKSRCADVAVPQINNSNQPDCMATYKACNRTCAKTDKNCQRECKGALMSCK